MTSPGDVVLELKELASALTTAEMQKEIQELKKECAGYTERLKNIKAATNHVTPEEKEQVGGGGEQGGLPVQVQSEEGRPQRLLWG